MRPARFAPPPVHAAFATVPRHRFLPHFRYRADEYTLDTTHEPPDDVLDIVYANNALLTHTGRDGNPTSSSSAPSIMAKMLEALDLRPGLRTVEIGAGTGYNAALIHHITGAPVVTVEAGRHAATEANTALSALGLDEGVHVIHGDGYLGYPDGAPYDRLIATCGIAGIPPRWLAQLAPEALIIAPVAHAGVHPILVISYRQGTITLEGQALLWSDFMPAAGPLRPAELFHHDPVRDVPTTDARHVPHAGPVLDQTQYHDLWCYLGTRDPRITRAYPDVDAFNLDLGACALLDPDAGPAWVHTDGSMTTTGDPEIGNQLAALVQEWDATGRPSVGDWTMDWRGTHRDADLAGLLLPDRWRARLDAGISRSRWSGRC
ncbi:MAG: protein-L-isoaspartate O-methyltransferase family protein [Pseudonocardiaceae bacterium]